LAWIVFQNKGDGIMDKYILQAHSITKSYGRQIILSNLNINIERGSIYGLIGKNGSGKTTLLKILTKLIPQYKGAVFADKKFCISALIDSPSLYLNMSANENMHHHALLLGIKEKSAIVFFLDLVGLSNIGNKKVSAFSLGMVQRLKIAISLLSNPELLILDEPLNGLDPEGITELRNLILNLNKKSGTTILISSHILSELEQVATRFGILHNGKIVTEFKYQDLVNTNRTLENIYMDAIKGGEKID
jgi:ABC-type multidrug transport system ATPase subunit